MISAISTEVLRALPPPLVRPASLNEVGPPGILLQVSKYGSPFLVVGDESDPTVIFLDGQFIFRSFKRSAAERWSGLAIENVEFEVDIDSAFDLSGHGKPPGSMLRKDGQLSIAAIADDTFRRTVQIPITIDLPKGSADLQVAFFSWRVVIWVRDERFILWECKLPAERDW